MSAATIRRYELAICPACEMEMCFTCFGGECLCACIDLAPPRPEPVPVPPVRCEDCGYLTAAPGHLLSCGPAECPGNPHARPAPEASQP